MNSMSYVDKNALFLSMHVIKCECYGSFEFVSNYGIARKEVFLLN